MRALFLAAPLLALAACAGGRGPTAESPKANPLARASIMSANPLSITISHSKWGERTAFQWADAHCAKFGKVAVMAGSSPQFGTDNISTWRCETAQ